MPLRSCRYATKETGSLERLALEEVAWLAKVQDEAGHDRIKALETSGKTVILFVKCRRQGQIQQYLQLSSTHLGRHWCHWLLVDGAAIVNQVMLQKTSYGPYQER